MNIFYPRIGRFVPNRRVCSLPGGVTTDESKDSIIPLTGLKMLRSFRQIFRSLRIRQWTKNMLLFAALIFSNQANDISLVLRSVAGFFLFSLCAGSVYILNDIHDCESDRLHPVKKNRPIACGALGLGTARAAFVVIAAGSLVLSFLFSGPFGIAVAVYFLIQLLYTFALKQVVILDVFTVSFSYLLRVIAGALVIGVVISNWILVCTFLLALFLTLSKRRHELTLLEATANRHREILNEYSPHLLDQMISVVTSATLVAYIIFTLDAETVEKFGNMVLTVPFVLYGIFRYLYLVHMKQRGGQPEEILLTDIPLLINILLYGIVVVTMIYVIG